MTVGCACAPAATGVSTAGVVPVTPGIDGASHPARINPAVTDTPMAARNTTCQFRSAILMSCTSVTTPPRPACFTYAALGAGGMRRGECTTGYTVDRNPDPCPRIMVPRVAV